MQKNPDLMLGSERSPGEGNATPSSILAWKIPWTEEPDSLWGRRRVGHDLGLNYNTSNQKRMK